MKADLIKQFNLPPYIKGKTFSDASKAIENKFKDRNDSAATETKNTLLERLSEAQEFVKMQDALKNESQQIPDQMQGEIPEGMEEFMPQNGMPDQNIQEQSNPMQSQMDMAMEQNPAAYGAIFSKPSKYAEGGFADMTGAEQGNAFSGAAAGALDLGRTAFGPSGIDTTGAMVAPDVQSRGSGALSGAAKGAAAGASFGPWGAAVGGVVGGVSGLLGAGRAQRDASAAGHKYALAQNSNLRQTDFGMGGRINKYVKGGKFDLGINPLNLNAEQTKFKNTYSNPINNLNLDLSKRDVALSDNNTAFPKHKFGASEIKKTIAGKAGKALNWLGENAGDIAQYSPIGSNLLSLKNLEQGATERGLRLDNTYQPQLYDEARLQNLVNQQNTERALTESSGGDLGALRSNLIASGAIKTKALSDGMAQADQINRSELQNQFQTRMGVDQANVSLDQNFIDRKAQDQGAFETTKGNLQRQIGEDIGNIGREESNKKLVKQMLGYKWNGKYWLDDKGNTFTSAQATAKAIEKSKTKD
jgi:hypothetical protein